jgi:hypothetical protein
LQNCFSEAWLRDPAGRAALVKRIREFDLDPRTLSLLISYAFGAPQRELTVRHLSLAQLVSGTALDALDDEDDDEPATH